MFKSKRTSCTTVYRHSFACSKHSVPYLVPICCYNNLQFSGKDFVSVWEYGRGICAHSAPEVRHWCLAKRPGVQSAFRFISEVFSGVEIGALYGTAEFFFSYHGEPFLLRAHFVNHTGTEFGLLVPMKGNLNSTAYTGDIQLTLYMFLIVCLKAISLPELLKWHGYKIWHFYLCVKQRIHKEKLVQEHNQLKQSMEETQQSLSGLCDSVCTKSSMQPEQLHVLARYLSPDSASSVLLTPTASPNLPCLEAWSNEPTQPDCTQANGTANKDNDNDNNNSNSNNDSITVTFPKPNDYSQT